MFKALGLLLSKEDEDLYNKHASLNDSGYYYISHPCVGEAGVWKYCEAIHRVVMWRMIQVLLPPRSIAVVGYINRNKLDCRRENLRLISHSLNKLREVQKRGVTGFIGVSRYKNVFRVQFKAQGKMHTFGCRDTVEEAAFLSDVWRYRILPDSATLNFPERMDEIEQEALKIDNPHWLWQRAIPKVSQE